MTGGQVPRKHDEHGLSLVKQNWSLPRKRTWNPLGSSTNSTTLVNVGEVGAADPQVFRKTCFATTGFEKN